MSSIDISIVIPAKNEEKYIGATLDRVFGQEIDKRYEVILLDSGSEDFTLDITKRYPVKIIEIPPGEFGHGRTRNKGAQIAKGDIVVFLNADALPMDEHWLKSLVENFKDDERIAGVYSHIYPRSDCNPLRSWEILKDSPYYSKKRIKYIEDIDKYHRMRARDKRQFLAFQSISCAIRRDFLQRYPFKDIDFGEDLEWSKRIIERGFKIVFEPDSIVLHSHDFYFSFTQTFKKYLVDTKLNNELFNLWTWCNLPMLIAHIGYKLMRDIGYIIALNRRLSYKITWLFYSPVIRLAEFFGIIFAIR